MKRVFILATKSMFGQGVARLLRQEIDCKIVGQKTDLHQAMACIQKIQPDVVIVDAHHRFGEMALDIVQILTALPNAKVIALNLKNNTFQIYQSSQKKVDQLTDLIEAITGET